MNYGLTVEYSFKKYRYELENKIVKLLRRPSDGSGVCLHTCKRDVGWVWTRRAYRDRAVKRLRAKKIPGLKITTSEWES